MKILMVITGMKTGGAERVFSTLANYLAEHHEVRLLALKNPVSDYYLSENVDFRGAGAERDKLLPAVKGMKAHMEEFQPDVVLSFMTKTNIVALLGASSSKYKAPVVVAERGNPFFPGMPVKILRWLLFKKAEGAVFQTRQAKAYYRKLIRCEGVILRNPLNPAFLVPAYTGKKTKRIVNVGRLYPEKNQKLLVDGFAEIADQHPDYCVEIYGEGPMHQELEDYIAEKGMTGRVVLMGRSDHIQDCIRDAALFAFTSNSEGSPNALLEAMALGLPCIATDCPIGGPADIIQDGENGFLIPMNDKDQLAARMQEILSNEELAEKLGRNAHLVTENYAPDAVCKDWEEYLEKIANGVN